LISQFLATGVYDLLEHKSEFLAIPAPVCFYLFFVRKFMDGDDDMLGTKFKQIAWSIVSGP
jgi:hypothetical protein